MECVDIVVLCVAASGEQAANLTAHVGRDWLRATRQLWPYGWTSGAAAAASSIERFRWAQSIGCPWRGRALLRAAARAGALDLLKMVAERYTEWDHGATIEAAEADRVDVVEWVIQRGWIGRHGLRGAGPRVRALPLVRELIRGLSTHTDPARLADGAVQVDGSSWVDEGIWGRVAGILGRIDIFHGPQAALDALARAKETSGRPAQMLIEHMAWNQYVDIRGWTLIHGLRALPGTKIVRVSHNSLFAPSLALPEALDPRRVWFSGPLLVEVEPNQRFSKGDTTTPALGCSYIATLATVSPSVVYGDGRFVYNQGTMWRNYPTPSRPLARADGLDDDRHPILY
jgi:hypothetical protein